MVAQLVWDQWAAGSNPATPTNFSDSRGPLAQRLEQPAHNRSVLGSTPRWPTIHSIEYAQIAQLVEQETENLRVLGSIPSLGTTQDPDKFRIFSFVRNTRFFKAVKVRLNTCKDSFTSNTRMPRMTITLNLGRLMLPAAVIAMLKNRLVSYGKQISADSQRKENRAELPC